MRQQQLLLLLCERCLSVHGKHFHYTVLEESAMSSCSLGQKGALEIGVMQLLMYWMLLL